MASVRSKAAPARAARAGPRGRGRPPRRVPESRVCLAGPPCRAAPPVPAEEPRLLSPSLAWRPAGSQGPGPLPAVSADLRFRPRGAAARSAPRARGAGPGGLGACPPRVPWSWVRTRSRWLNPQHQDRPSKGRRLEEAPPGVTRSMAPLVVRVVRVAGAGSAFLPSGTSFLESQPPGAGRGHSRWSNRTAQVQGRPAHLDGGLQDWPGGGEALQVCGPALPKEGGSAMRKDHLRFLPQVTQ